jgi:hypothetical protein
MMTAAIVTTTNGRSSLRRTVESVYAQTRPAKHYIVTDGILSFERFAALRDEYPRSETMWCSQKVGGLNLEGRRLVAASSYLVKEDVVFFLNDDDWYEPTHVEELMRVIEEGNDWAYSHRKIFDQNGDYLCDDLCESIGEQHDIWNSPGNRFVETCSIAMRTEPMIRLAQVYWHPGYGPDRLFYHHAKQLFPRFRWSGGTTMCFTVGGNELSVQKEFFEMGNAYMRQKYPDGMPWL